MMRLAVDKGLSLDLGATPTRHRTSMPDRVALLGADYPGVRPQLAVQVGDTVSQGDVLFTDRARPALRFTAPIAGRIEGVHLGPRRRLESVVIGADRDPPPPPSLIRGTPRSADAVREGLLHSGLWSSLRRRPYDQIPDPSERVDELYVVAVDSNPLAPDPLPLLAEKADAFRAGLEALATLVRRCYLCIPEGADVLCPPSVVPVAVRGPHPAGLPGTLIYGVSRLLGRVQPSGPVWHVGYQDVIAIGTLCLDGRLDPRRSVSVAGPGRADGELVTTLTGAALDTLTGALPGEVRPVSGPALSGREPGHTTGYLGRYHVQVVMLPAPDHEDGIPDGAGMLALKVFEGVWPLGIPVLPLLRAVLVEDTESVVQLGGTHLAPEDLALCAYVCPARQDYAAALERTLEAIRLGR